MNVRRSFTTHQPTPDTDTHIHTIQLANICTLAHAKTFITYVKTSTQHYHKDNSLKIKSSTEQVLRITDMFNRVP